MDRFAFKEPQTLEVLKGADGLHQLYLAPAIKETSISVRRFRLPTCKWVEWGNLKVSKLPSVTSGLLICMFRQTICAVNDPTHCKLLHLRKFESQRKSDTISLDYRFHTHLFLTGPLGHKSYLFIFFIIIFMFVYLFFYYYYHLHYFVLLNPLRTGRHFDIGTSFQRCLNAMGPQGYIWCLCQAKMKRVNCKIHTSQQPCAFCPRVVNISSSLNTAEASADWSDSLVYVWQFCVTTHWPTHFMFCWWISYVYI